MINALSKDFPVLPIWLAGGGEKDEYVDFFPEVPLKKGLQYTVQIAADTDYNVYVGGRLVAFGQYAGYPDMVTYDTVTFTAENDGDALEITAWHCGVDSSTYINHPAYVAFCIYCEGELVYSSSAKTKSAFHPTYLQHQCLPMTSQIGPGFALDGTAAPQAAAESAEIDIGTVTVNERPNRRLELQAPVIGRLIRSGAFRYKGDACAAVRMKEALLDVPADAADGVRIVPATFSMACFRYDALLAADREKYTPVILNEIDRDCGFMLDHGATTFWETMVGQADFGGAGSLCHGWSAMAAYYYDILTK